MSRKDREKRRERKIEYTSSKQRVKDQQTGFTPTAFKLPKGMELFKVEKAGNKRINIIPYIVGKGNPYAEEGKVHYERTYFVHRGVGPNNESLACLNKNFGKKCPICDHRARLANSPDSDEDLIKTLKPKERQLFIVQDIDDLEKGLQIMETSHYKGFGELLHNKIDADDEDEYINFFHLEDGLTLKVTYIEDSYQGRKFLAPSNIEMKVRKKQLDPDILDEAPCLDDLIIKMDYDEMKKKFLEVGDDDDEKDKEKERRKKKSRKDDEDDDEDADDDDDDKDDDAGSGDDDDTDDDETDSDDDDDADDNDKKKSSKKSKKASDDDEDDEDDEDDDGDEEAPSVKVGDTVTFEYKDKKRKGVVEKVNTKNSLAHVRSEGRSDPYIVALDELKVVGAKKAKEEDEDEDEDDTPKSKSQKTSKDGTKKPSKSSDDDDDDDEDEEEEKPKKSKSKKKKDDDDDDVDWDD
jgi:hypothetical protein